MYILESTPFDELYVDEEITLYREVIEQDIDLFSTVSGDMNPIHLDEKYARDTIFGERIAHGMLSGAIISAALSCSLPGPGSVYLSQNLKFLSPIKIGDVIEIKLKVLEKIPQNRVKVSTQIFNQTGKQLVDGDAFSYVPNEKQTVHVNSFPFLFKLA